MEEVLWEKKMSQADSLFESLVSLEMNALLLVKLTHLRTS